MEKNGHWYTDKNGKHYFVENGQSPKEGWEASNRRKMLKNGKYNVSEDGVNYKEVEEDEYRKFEADEDFDIDDVDSVRDFDEEEVEYVSGGANGKKAKRIAKELGLDLDDEDEIANIEMALDEGMSEYDIKAEYEKEPNPMDEFSGPDQEGPSYAQLEADFKKGKTVDAPEKGEGWKKTKMASGTLYEGPNGERELENDDLSEDELWDKYNKNKLSEDEKEKLNKIVQKELEDEDSFNNISENESEELKRIRGLIESENDPYIKQARIAQYKKEKYKNDKGKFYTAEEGNEFDINTYGEARSSKIEKEKREKNLNKEENNTNINIFDENGKPNYSNLVQFSNNDSEEYNIAKEAIVNHGRDLAKKLSIRDSELTEEGRKIKKAIIKASKPSPADFSIYRTDDVNWLGGTRVGSQHLINLYLGGSLDENLTIDENKGNVKQKMKINIKKGDPIIIPNNASEQEVDLVRTKDFGQGLKIINVTKDENGIPVYEAEFVK